MTSRSRLMLKALDDCARRREDFGRLTMPEILIPCWIAATRIARRDPAGALAIMAALIIIDLNQYEKKAGSFGEEPAARSSRDVDRGPTTPSVLRARQPVNSRRGSVMGRLLLTLKSAE